jgi:hypothetical protein
MVNFEHRRTIVSSTSALSGSPIFFEKAFNAVLGHYPKWKDNQDDGKWIIDADAKTAYAQTNG